MAPVGSDKELSDLLDFSMVSPCPTVPIPAPGLEVRAEAGVSASRSRAPSLQELGESQREWSPHHGVVIAAKEMVPSLPSGEN